MSVTYLDRPLSAEERSAQLPIDDFYSAYGGGTLELTYIHQAALAQVASINGPEYAQQLCDGLGSMRMRRLIGHHLMAPMLDDPNSIEYRLASTVVERELDVIDGGRQDLRWLSGMYGVAETPERTNYYRLLNPQNRMVSSCYDDGFYTLAQTKDASVWMDNDNEDFSTFLPRVAQGDGPKFLTIVRGGAYASGEFASADYATIPARIILADTVFLAASDRSDGTAYATIAQAPKETLSVKELDEIEFDSRIFKLGIVLNAIDKRIDQLRDEASTARWIGREAYAQTKIDLADLLAGSRKPLQNIFGLRHFSPRHAD